MTDFTNSELHKSIIQASHSKERLTNKLNYIKAAVNYWIKRDKEQFIFFRDAEHLTLKLLLSL
jgi:hypothetical protein